MFTNDIFQKRLDEVLAGAANDDERASIEFARIATARKIDNGHPFPLFVYHQGMPLWRGTMGILKYRGAPTRFVLIYSRFDDRNEEIWIALESPDA